MQPTGRKGLCSTIEWAYAVKLTDGKEEYKCRWPTASRKRSAKSFEEGSAQFDQGKR
jgi:hypothetical protein